MSWRRLGLILMISPALAVAALGGLLGPPGATVIVPIAAAVFAFAFVVARAEPTGAEGHDGVPVPGPGAPPRTGAGASVPWRAVRAALLAAAVAAAAVLVVTGLVTLTGAATAPILLLWILAAVPWAWPRLRPHLDRNTVPEHDAGAATTAAGAETDLDPSTGGPSPTAGAGVESLSTRALCAAWQRSYFELAHAPDRRARDELVGRRRRYLDELADRDHAALGRWLTADPRAAGADPHPHFAPARKPVAGRPVRDHPSYFDRGTPPSP